MRGAQEQDVITFAILVSKQGYVSLYASNKAVF